MIIVTGGAGFIGSNIVRALNERGCVDVIIVDNLTDGHKFENIVDLKILDYLDQEVFLHRLIHHDFDKIEAIFHEGACSTTTEWDGRFMMNNNFEYSKHVLHYCLKHQVQFIYASSAAVYGDGKVFKEDPKCERPLNVYGYSKYLFDQYVRNLSPKPRTQIVGCRYFNVYGPRESHKGSMASVAFHLNEQMKKTGIVRLFEGCDGFGNGEQKRDFVYVNDVANVNLWFLDHPKVSGIFNVGTGRAQTFNDVARAVINWYQNKQKNGRLEYIPFPDHLKGCYQSFTEADLSMLRKVGCDVSFRAVEIGVANYLDILNSRINSN